jgi:hypothetical protein
VFRQVADGDIRSGKRLSFSISLADVESDNFSAFEQGKQARKNWETWFAGLSGAARDGANYWASERNNRARQTFPSCSDGTGRFSSEFGKYCTSAKQYLTAIDSRCKSDKDYKDGWNSY